MLLPRRLVRAVLAPRRSAHSSTLDAIRRSTAGRSFKEFLPGGGTPSAGPAGAGIGGQEDSSPHYLQLRRLDCSQNKVYVETYGCQMNVSDSEIVLRIMADAGYERVDSVEEANIVFLNTCAIRENAEDKVWRRLESLKKMRRSRGLVVGVLGCMAERLKTSLLDHRSMVDLVCGPDAYRDLPRLVHVDQDTAINVILSADETYADVSPIRLSPESRHAFVSIQRGCNNLCSYCVVPQTRGRERSRPVDSVVREVRELVETSHVKEITLLGQNVNSYAFHLADADAASDADASSPAPPAVSRASQPAPLARGFSSIVRIQPGGVRFAELLDTVASIDSEVRIRFTSPHPKDFPTEVLDVVASRPNVCKSLHIPAQSGSTAVLSKMRRGYSRDAYLDLVSEIRNRIPDVALSSDFIAGFCGESDDDHRQTVSLLEHVQYDHAFLFAYSLREKTHAQRKLSDNVPHDVKQSRLSELIAVFHKGAAERNLRRVGTIQLVLVEKPSRRNADTHLAGRADNNVRVNFSRSAVPVLATAGEIQRFLSVGLVVGAPPAGLPAVEPVVGDYVAVQIEDSTSTSLRGRALFRTTLSAFSQAGR